MDAAQAEALLTNPNSRQRLSCESHYFWRGLLDPLFFMQNSTIVRFILNP